MRQLSIAVLVVLAFSNSARAQQPSSPTTMLTEIYNAQQPPKQYFSNQFLKQISIQQLSAILANARGKFGNAMRSEGRAGNYQIITAGHRIPVTMALNQDQRIVGLLFKPGIPRLGEASQFIAQIKQLPGSTALLLTKNSKAVLSYNSDKPLAVGSTFKLAVLVALQNKIEQRKANWSDVIRLQARDTSFPSGILQDMPPGAPLTLHTLASLMIARSDNTATDALMHYLGRKKVEAIAGLQPMLTTREMFQLKADRHLYDSYAKANMKGRRAVLEGLTKTGLPNANHLAKRLRAFEEWYIPLNKVCDWLNRVRKLDLMRINPGLATRSDWKTIAYKGGSNSGVLNFSTWLEDINGNHYCLAITWNANAGLDQTTLTGLYTGLIDLIHRKQLK